MMLIYKISRAKADDQQEMLNLIERFSPLIKKYAWKLNYEDAENDLILEFIQLIKDFDVESLKCREDGAITNYICKSMQNRYIYLLKRLISIKVESVSYDQITEEQLSKLSISECSDEKNLKLDDNLLLKLTPKERVVIEQIIIYGYSSVDIAKKLDTTKENINQIKLRALKKIRSSLENS